MTHLVIVRHAESEFNLQNRIQGHYDSRLTARGLRQAKRLAQRLGKIKIDRIYSSDLGRAYSTSLEVARRLDLRIAREPLLREINLGAWEGMTPEEVDLLYAKGYQRWLRKPSACVIPRAERVSAFRKRIVKCVRGIARRHRGETVLVVTHGGAITALIAEWLEADFDAVLFNVQIDNTSVTLANETDARVKLLSINDTAHLNERKRLVRG